MHLLLRAFCDELARCGVTDVCTSPGSRSTPLVVALSREPGLRTWSHVDERSGSFFALGLAKATRRPVVLACTSGTAAANYVPAVIEAHEARVPLIVLTADRPPELRDIGAGQTIDQVKLYGTAAKWFVEVGNHDETPEAGRWMRQLGCRAVWTASDGRPGPVHLNFGLREPLLPPAELPADPAPGRPDGAPWLSRTPARTDAAPLTLPGRGLVVAGRDEDPEAGAQVAGWAAALGWPVLADPLSGARRGPAAVAHYDLLLRDAGWADAHAPEVVVRTGDLPTSKPLRRWLGRLDCRQVVVGAESAWQDPGQSAHHVHPGPLTGLRPARAPSHWLDSWRRADAAAAAVYESALASGVSEPGVARRLGAQLSAEELLWVASSMPVRDVEAFVAVRDDPPRVLANRGANGIDGTVSSAFGAAAGGARTTLLTGDVTLLHDLGGLIARRRLGLDALRVVVLDNDGGGIFHFLPVAEEKGLADVFEEHVATPHGLDFERVAALFDFPYTAAGSLDDLQSRGLVHVRTDRGQNRTLHAELAEAALRAVRES